MCRCLVSARTRIACLALLTGGTCHAAADISIDLVGFVLYTGGYLLGLLALLLTVALSKRKAAWGRVLAAYVGVPVALAVATLAIDAAGDALQARKARMHESENLQAFAAYCKDRQRLVNARVPTGTGSSLLIRIQSGFPADRNAFSASVVHDHIESSPTLCEKTGLVSMEGFVDQYTEEKKADERKVEGYRLCTREKWVAAAQPRSRYELVLGELVDKQPAPWGSYEGRWMTRSSVRVLDRQSGATLAQDTMYFLGRDNGVGGCPVAMDQLTSLLTDVFPED